MVILFLSLTIISNKKGSPPHGEPSVFILRNELIVDVVEQCQYRYPC